MPPKDNPSKGPPSRDQPSSSSSSSSASDSDNEELEEAYRTHQAKLQKVGSAYWDNPRFPWRNLPLSPIPESPYRNGHEDASDVESSEHLDNEDTEMDQLNESLEKLSMMLKGVGKSQKVAGKEPVKSAASASASYQLDSSSSSGEGGTSDDSLLFNYSSPARRKQRRNVSNASTMVLTPDASSPDSNAADSPGRGQPSFGSPDSFPGKGKRALGKGGGGDGGGRARRRRRRVTRHYTTGVERLQFYTYIYSLFKSTHPPGSRRRQSGSRSQVKSTGRPPPNQNATEPPGRHSPGAFSVPPEDIENEPPEPGRRSSGAFSVPPSDNDSDPLEPPPQSPLEAAGIGKTSRHRRSPDPNRVINKISWQSMTLLNSVVKDLIHRFAVETNRLLKSSKRSTLREEEVIAAIRMMLRHRPDLCNKVIAQHFQGTASWPANRRTTGRGQGKGRGGAGSGKRPMPQGPNTKLTTTIEPSSPSTPLQEPQAAASTGKQPSRYGAGFSPEAGPSSRH